MFRLKTKLFTAAPESALLEWCDEKSATRYVALASAIPKNPLAVAETSRVPICVPPGAPGRVWPGHRAAAAGNFCGRYDSFEGDDRSGRPGFGPRKGGGFSIESRNQSDRD